MQGTMSALGYRWDWVMNLYRRGGKRLFDLVFAAAALLFIPNFLKKQNARMETIPAIQKLVKSGFRPPVDAFILANEAKKYIAPLPVEVDFELPGYKEMAVMMAGHMGDAGGKKIVAAQAVKDATMAYFIAENLPEGKVMYHFNGSYHSQNKEGIVYYLQKSRPELKIITITVVEQEDISELEEENQSLADFIIAIPDDMTKTY